MLPTTETTRNFRFRVVVQIYLLKYIRSIEMSDKNKKQMKGEAGTTTSVINRGRRSRSAARLGTRELLVNYVLCHKRNKQQQQLMHEPPNKT